MRDRMKSQNQHPPPAPPRAAPPRTADPRKKETKQRKKAKLNPRATFHKRTKLPYMRTYSFRFHIHSNYRHRHNYQQTQKKKKKKVKNSRQWEVEEILHKITKISSDSSKTSSSPLNNDRLLLWPRPVNETTSQSVFERKKERNRSNRMHGSALPRFRHFPEFSNQGARRGRKKARKKKTNKAERYARTHFNRNTRADRAAGHTEDLFL